MRRSLGRIQTILDTAARDFTLFDIHVLGEMITFRNAGNVRARESYRVPIRIGRSSSTAHS